MGPQRIEFWPMTPSGLLFKTRLPLTIAMALLFMSVAEGQAAIEFRTIRHNYGTIEEDGGVKNHDFIFTNNGDSPLLITRVVPSCGCTTPDWTREPVPPGETGFIRSSMNPMNMPGPFTKTIAVHSNGQPSPMVLTLTGVVNPRERSVEEQFRWALGPVRFESNHIDFSRTGKGEQKSREMHLINVSDSHVVVGFGPLPQHLSLEVVPSRLAPGERAVVKAVYDASTHSGWGAQNDLVALSFNGVIDNSAFLYITANLLEDFSGWSEEQIANAPVASFESTTFDVGEIPVNQSSEVEFSLTNEGATPLKIRYVRVTCGCTVMEQPDESIEPGNTTSIKATYTSGALPGAQQRVLFVYTNDPQMPEIMLIIKAEVVKGASGPYL